MRRVVLVALLGLSAVAGVVWRLELSAPDGLNAATLVRLRRLDAGPGWLEDVRFRPDGSLEISVLTPGREYADEREAEAFAGRVLRAAAGLYLEEGFGKRPERISVRLLPAEDMLLTREVPRERKVERDFRRVLMEEVLGREVPGARVAGLEGGFLKVEARGKGLKRLAEAFPGLVSSELFRGVRGLEVSGRRYTVLDLRLVAAAWGKGFPPGRGVVSVEASDAGPVVCLVAPPGDVPDVFPAPLPPDAPLPGETLSLQEALLEAFRSSVGRDPAGVFTSVDGRAFYQSSGDLRLRIAERDDVVLWGDTRFPVEGGYSPSWKYVIIHHTATEGGTFRSIDRYHRKVKGWEHGAGYHFIIGNGNGIGDGEIIATPRWKEQIPGAHAGNAEWNRISIGVALVGDFEEHAPTPAQMKALEKLCRYLLLKFRIPVSHVMGHRQCPAAHTLCPGRFFPMEEFSARLARLPGAAAVPRPGPSGENVEGPGAPGRPSGALPARPGGE